jgi:hypothetical protein
MTLHLYIFYPVFNAIFYEIIKFYFPKQFLLVYGYSVTTLIIICLISLFFIKTIKNNFLILNKQSLINKFTLIYLLIILIFFIFYLISDFYYNSTINNYYIGNKLYFYFLFLIIPSIYLVINCAINRIKFYELTNKIYLKLLLLLIFVIIIINYKYEGRLSLEKLNPNSVALYLGILYIYLMNFDWEIFESKIYLVLSLAVKSLILYLISLTSSIGISIALLIAISIEAFSSNSFKNKEYLLYIVLLLISVFFIKISFPGSINNTASINSFETEFYDDKIDLSLFERTINSLNRSDSTLYDRLEVYKKAIEEFKKLNLFGGGFDVGGIMSPHNIFLEAFFIGGVFLFLILFFFYILLIYYYFKLKKKCYPDFYKPGAIFLFLFFNSLFGGIFFTSVPLIIFTVYLAFMCNNYFNQKNDSRN